MATALPAAAQQPQPLQVQPLKVSANKPFRHKHSRLALPATLDGLPRAKVSQIVADQVDVFATYERPGTDEIISVYIYRQVAGAVPIWFDRARWAIEHRPEVYGTPALAPGDLTFVPPGQANASGMIAAYTLTKPPFRSTAVALLPVGEWLVKLRYSSASLEAATLSRRVRDVLATLDWPTVPAAPAAEPVAPCTTPLALSGEARPLPPSAESMVWGSLFAQLVSQAKPAANAAPVRWCIDAEASRQAGGGGVYRASGADDAYLLALSDAGRAFRVGPSGGMSLMTQVGQRTGEKETPAARWSVEGLDLDRTLVFADQDRLPPPEQVLGSIIRRAPTSTVTTWGKKRQVSLDAGALAP